MYKINAQIKNPYSQSRLYINNNINDTKNVYIFFFTLGFVLNIVERLRSID